MDPIQDIHLCVAPAFYSSQIDLCGPFNAYSNANKRTTIKVWITVFCCCTTGDVDCKLMEDYSTDSLFWLSLGSRVVLGTLNAYYLTKVSQLVKGCNYMVIKYSSLQGKLSTEYGVEYRKCPVGTHYMHGKVERKIQHIKKSISKELNNRRPSVIRWETICAQIANSVNNMPIGLGGKVECIENLDILTPNHLILGRNNKRCPSLALELSRDYKRIIETNAKIFAAWFDSWLVSYVPTLIDQPKWFKTDVDVCVGDVVIF